MSSGTNRPTPIWAMGMAVSLAVSGLVWWRFQQCKRENDDDTASSDYDDDMTTPATPMSPMFPKNLDQTDFDHTNEKNDSGLQRQMYKERRRQEKIPLLAMKKPMYDNIQMLDPQGTVLCTISKKKANWYVSKQLATWVVEPNDNDNSPPQLQLNFEPSHRSNLMDKSKDNDNSDSHATFNTSLKRNICVVCGADQYHMRHYIVPYTCRSLLPSQYKEHMAHDVVILCPDCHLECKHASEARMKFLERQCRVGLPEITAVPMLKDAKAHKVKSCATALQKHRAKLPPAKMNEYEQLVQEYFQKDNNDDNNTLESLLEQATQLVTETPNPRYVPAATLIVSKFCTSPESIEAFVKGWRAHFLETMQPQHLPQGWSLESAVQSTSVTRKKGPSIQSRQAPSSRPV